MLPVAQTCNKKLILPLFSGSRDHNKILSEKSGEEYRVRRSGLGKNIGTGESYTGVFEGKVETRPLF